MKVDIKRDKEDGQPNAMLTHWAVGCKVYSDTALHFLDVIEKKKKKRIGVSYLRK